MSKKTFMATIIISAFLISLVGGMQVVEVAKANPVPWQATPNQEKPNLTIETPQNYTTYNASGTLLNFTVIKPDSWNIVHMFVLHYIGEIASIDVYLDGNLSTHYAMYGSNSTRFSVMLNQSALGMHKVNVTVLSFTYYRGPAYNNSHILSDITSSSGPVYEYPIVVSDIVYFTVVEEPSLSPPLTVSPIITPSPSPSPSPSPTPSLIILVDSPQNKTYTTQYVPISISASDPTKHIGPESIGYSLDEGPLHIIAKIPVGGHSLNESTVMVLPDGSYNLVAIAITWFNGAAGIFRSSPIYFTVNTSPPTPQGGWQETASLLIVATVIAVILIAITAFGVSRKRARV